MFFLQFCRLYVKARAVLLFPTNKLWVRHLFLSAEQSSPSCYTRLLIVCPGLLQVDEGANVLPKRGSVFTARRREKSLTLLFLTSVSVSLWVCVCFSDCEPEATADWSTDVRCSFCNLQLEKISVSVK